MEVQLTPNLQANGNIVPNRFVMGDSSGDFLGIQATLNAQVLGCTTGATRFPVTPQVATPNAAEDGDGVVLQDGLIWEVEAGGAISAFDRVYSDASGRAITAEAAGQVNFVGIALESAAAAVDILRVMYIPQLSGEYGNIQSVKSAVLDHAAFTDGGAAVGTISMGAAIPANAVVLGYHVEVTEAFAGDVSADLELGDGSDPDRWGSADDPSVFAIAADLGSFLGAAAAFTAVANTPTVTITTNADWTSVTAGKCFITVYYFLVAPGA